MNIDAFIASQLNSGMSLDQLGEELSCALNRKQAEINKENRREERRSGLVDNINAAIDTGSIDFKTAASAAAAYIIAEHPDWSDETVDAFYKEVVDLLQSTEAVYKGRVTGEPTVKILDELCNSIFDVLIAGGKPKQEKKETKPGTDREKVERFLRNLQ